MTDSYEALFRRTAQGIKPGLDIISELLQALDHPHRRLAAVHVAGTNGKGSVCCMLESVLRASGFRTGLYTSPHLIDFSERFRINGIPITSKRLDAYIQQVEATADRVAEERAQRPATFFEISTAIAFQYFAEEQVDIAIIETGMGGRWDATNVIIPLLSVITHIDIDHTDFLGNTIREIAAEKAGIIKAGRPVVSAPQSEEVMAILKAAGETVICSAEAVSISRKKSEPDAFAGGCQILKIETLSRSLPPIRLPLHGPCQRENCAVAIAALERLADLLDFEPAFRKGLEAVWMPARLELLRREPLTLLDGAHNPSAARALSGTLREAFPGFKIGFILAFLDNKDVNGFLREIRPIAARVWTVQVDDPRAATAASGAQLARALDMTADPMDAPDAWSAAGAWASAGPDRLICLTGTLRLAACFPPPTAAPPEGSGS